ncbi:unnamed protein product [Gordionus sp. m RMFG-2023]
MGEHLGINKTNQIIAENFYWLGSNKSVRKFIKSCENKTAKSVVKALYIIVNTHQSYEIQINDQGREFYSSSHGLYDEIIPLATEFVDPNSPRDSNSQNGLHVETIPLATEFVDPKSPRAARVLLIDSGSQNDEFEDKNIQLDRDFINPKTLIENIPRYFFPTTNPPKRCRDVDYGKQLGEPTILVQIEFIGIVFIGRLV